MIVTLLTKFFVKIFCPNRKYGLFLKHFFCFIVHWKKMNAKDFYIAICCKMSNSLIIFQLLNSSISEVKIFNKTLDWRILSLTKITEPKLLESLITKTQEKFLKSHRNRKKNLPTLQYKNEGGLVMCVRL